jgi:hypothetical protein
MNQVVGESDEAAGGIPSANQVVGVNLNANLVVERVPGGK